MKELTTTQKKEWAKTLYLKENLTQQEIADRVGVTRVTVNSWINKEKWEEQKTGITLTREEQVANLYRQVAEINRAIANRPVGERYANSKEADILGKLSSSIEKMEKDVALPTSSVCLQGSSNGCVPLTLRRRRNSRNLLMLSLRINYREGV